MRLFSIPPAAVHAQQIIRRIVPSEGRPITILLFDDLGVRGFGVYEIADGPGVARGGCSILLSIRASTSYQLLKL